jgi:hypothetical protein
VPVPTTVVGCEVSTGSASAGSAVEQLRVVLPASHGACGVPASTAPASVPAPASVT